MFSLYLLASCCRSKDRQVESTWSLESSKGGHRHALECLWLVLGMLPSSLWGPQEQSLAAKDPSPQEAGIAAHKQRGKCQIAVISLPLSWRSREKMPLALHVRTL